MNRASVCATRSKSLSSTIVISRGPYASKEISGVHSSFHSSGLGEAILDSGKGIRSRRRDRRSYSGCLRRADLKLWKHLFSEKWFRETQAAERLPGWFTK